MPRIRTKLKKQPLFLKEFTIRSANIKGTKGTKQSINTMVLPENTKLITGITK